jgi:transposase
MAKRSRRVFPQEFKVEAVRLAHSSSSSIAAVARDLDVNVTTLRDWIQRTDGPATESAALSPTEKQELLQLRRDNAVLKMEREILKKAAAFFAKESR